MSRYLLLAFGLFAAICLSVPATAQQVPNQANVVSACGTPNNTYAVNQNKPVTQDTTGTLCTAGGGGGGGTVNQGSPGVSPWPFFMEDSSGADATDTTNHAVRVNVVAGNGVAQGSTTLNQTGALVQCAATTAIPAYTTATTNPCSVTANGGMRVTENPDPNALSQDSSQTTGSTDTTGITAVASKVIYVTSYQCSNSGTTTAEITFKNNTGGSTIGHTIVPAGSGSNVYGNPSFPLFKSLSGDPIVWNPSASSTTIFCTMQGIAQ